MSGDGREPLLLKGSAEVATYQEPRYPAWAVAQGERLRKLRLGPPYRSLREAALLVGLRAHEVGGLEHGRLTFATTVDADTYMRALGGA